MNSNTGSQGNGPTSGGGDDRRIELWVQPVPTLTGEYEEIVRKLGRLDRRDTIESFDVRTWDRFVQLDGRAAHNLAELRHWTWRHGGNLPGGERRTVGVGRMGPVETVERTPSVVMAEFRNGVLDRVTPCEGEVDCVTRRLVELERLATVRSRLDESRRRTESESRERSDGERSADSRERERLSF